MKIDVLSNDGLKHEFKVVITAAEISEKVVSKLAEIKTQIRLPGFRPGKVPTSLIKKKHGQAVLGEVLEDTVKETTTNLFEEKKITPALQPDVEVISFGEDKDLEFKLSVEVFPVIEAPDFKKIKLERPVAKVEAKEVDEALEKVAAQQKSFTKAPKTYVAKNGDAVIIDFVGTVNGVAFDGGTSEDFQLELGSQMFIPGFEDQLVGTKAGAKSDVTVTFPENYGSEDLSGKEAIFAVTVKEVQKPGAVKIDDALAKQLGLEDLKALKEALSTQIGMETDGLSKQIVKRALLDSLAEICTFDVPEGMVKVEFSQIWERIKLDAIQSGQATEGDFEGKDGPDDANERKDFEFIAERRVRLGLLLAEVGKQNDIQIAQEEVNRALMQEAQRFPGQEKEVFDYFKSNDGAMAQLRAPLYEEKVCDFILGVAAVKEKKVTRKQLEDTLKDLEESDEENTSKPKAKKASKAKAKPVVKKEKAATKEPVKKKAAPKKAAAKKPAAKKATAKKDK